MAVRGVPSHIDLSVSDPGGSIPFYAVFLEALGFRRRHLALAEFEGERPRRASWEIVDASGASFEIEVRPAVGEHTPPVNRYAPGLHHLAFHAESREDVERVHRDLVAADIPILDPPREYPDYSPGYYALFVADPDGIKLEVVHEPRANPTG